MSKSGDPVECIEDVTVKFIEALGTSAIKNLDNINPTIKVAFMLEVLKTLHDKG